jgi:CheY-like chemotaxis protein
MNKLVFIVEDDLVQQKMLQVHFEEMLGNYTVRTFSNPEDLLEHLKENPFAVVLDHFFSDKMGKTGLDYLRLMRKKYPSIPVIYHTTLEDEKVQSEVMSLGAEHYIIKNSASLVRLRTALDQLHEKFSKKGFFQKLFGN